MSLQPCWPHSPSDTLSYSRAEGPISHIAIKGRKLHFWRERAGHEVDFILEEAGKLVALEIKAGLHQVADPPRFWRRSRSSAFDP